MIRTLACDEFGNLTSVLDSAFCPPLDLTGCRVVTNAPIDFTPYAIVPRGSCGFVITSDPDTGYLEILLDKIIDGLRSWGNAFIVMPFDMPEAVAALTVIETPPHVNVLFVQQSWLAHEAIG